MKSATEYLWSQTDRQREFITITGGVEEIVKRSGVADGFALISATYIIAGVYAGVRQ